VGRAAARRNAPKQLCAIRVGPLQGGGGLPKKCTDLDLSLAVSSTFCHMEHIANSLEKKFPSARRLLSAALLER